MAEYLSAAHRRQRWATIGKIGSWFTGAGASIYLSLTMLGTAETMGQTEMQLTAGNGEVELSEIAGGAVEYVSEQAKNATVVSGLAGILALLGIGGAAYWSHKRSEENERRERLEAIRQEWLAEQTAKEDWEAYYQGRARVLELTRPKTVYEMDNDELVDLVAKRAAEPLGDGYYRSRSFGKPITGDVEADSSAMLDAFGPVQVDFRDSSGNYYLADAPTAEYKAVA